MQAVAVGVWSRIPGYQSDSDSEAEGPDGPGFLPRTQTCLQDVVKECGGRWVDVPLLEFAPMPMPLRLGAKDVPRSSACSRGTLDVLRQAHFRFEGIEVPLLRQTLLAGGLQASQSQDDDQWNLHWSNPRFISDSIYRHLHKHQRINHFLGSTELTHKDKLWSHFREQKAVFGAAAFDFVPESFVLPGDLNKFQDRHGRAGDNTLWIVKKPAGSCGRGIFLLRSLDQLPRHGQAAVVSQYVRDPLLIQGLKFDLRIYVLVTGYEPLRAYIYREGLARFASRPYSTEDAHLDDLFRHLTNYSINKHAHNFVENSDVHADNVGHKWSLSALNRHLECEGYDVQLIWTRIMDLIVKTLLAVEPVIRLGSRKHGVNPMSCFELYGFDVLVDKALKPWLLEVNIMPSMTSESPLDWKIKSSLLSDTLNLVGVCREPLDTVRRREARARQFEERRSATGSPVKKQRAPRKCSKEFSAASAKSAAKAVDFEQKALLIDTLDSAELNMLAMVLKEFKRSHNFIRLYPTHATIRRYAPIVELREPIPRCDHGYFYGCQLTASQLLASVLYGPKLLRCSEVSCLQSCPRSIKSGGRMSAFPCDTTFSFNSIRSSKQKSCPALAQVKFDGSKSKLLLDSLELQESSTTTTPRKFLDAMHVLGSNYCCRLALMEYLIRTANACDKLSTRQRRMLEQSTAFARLSSFRYHLLGVMARLERSLTSQLDMMDITSGLDLVDGIVAACTEALGLLKREVWAGVMPGDFQALRERCVTLGECLAPVLMQSQMWRDSVKVVQSLSNADLEYILESKRCKSDFGSILPRGGCDQDVVAGPLCEILQALSLRQQLELRPLAVPHGRIIPMTLSHGVVVPPSVHILSNLQPVPPSAEDFAIYL